MNSPDDKHDGPSDLVKRARQHSFALAFEVEKLERELQEARSAERPFEAWLIERGSPAEYWVSGTGKGDGTMLREEWTADAYKAQRFSEWGAKKHAEQLESWGVKGPLRACGHTFNCGIEPEAPRSHAGATEPYQEQVRKFVLTCFGPQIADDVTERNHRFLEESLELVQAIGCTASEAHQLVDYVYGRPVGEPHAEAGGVMTTLAALCSANGLNMDQAGQDELRRVWGRIDIIREKQRAKPKHSPLPEAPRSASVPSLADIEALPRIVPSDLSPDEQWRRNAEYICLYDVRALFARAESTSQPT